MDPDAQTTPLHVRVRLYGALTDLGDAPETTVPVGAPRSVKDVVESLGVPHPEVGLLVVDDRPVGFDHLVRGGERVAAYPPFRSLDLAQVPTVWPEPPPKRRFVLDVHLGTLARRLRLLGFDCWYRTDADDTTLVDVAVAEGRILLTRDRELLMRRVISHGYCPRADDPDRQLDEVVHRYDLASRAAPLTRCARCNGALTEVAAETVADELLPGTRAAGYDRFSRCERCGQVYWPGAHRDAVGTIVERATHS